MGLKTICKTCGKMIHFDENGSGGSVVLHEPPECKTFELWIETMKRRGLITNTIVSEKQ